MHVIWFTNCLCCVQWLISFPVLSHLGCWVLVYWLACTHTCLPFFQECPHPRWNGTRTQCHSASWTILVTASYLPWACKLGGCTPTMQESSSVSPGTMLGRSKPTPTWTWPVRTDHFCDKVTERAKVQAVDSYERKLMVLIQFLTVFRGGPHSKFWCLSCSL